MNKQEKKSLANGQKNTNQQQQTKILETKVNKKLKTEGANEDKRWKTREETK